MGLNSASVRHFGFKDSAGAVTADGYTQQGRLIIKDTASTINGMAQPPALSGVTWQIGPDETRFDIIICYTLAEGESFQSFNTEGKVSDAGYEPGDGSDQASLVGTGEARSMAFKGVSTADYVGVAEDLTGQSFLDPAAATAWLNTHNCWTSHVADSEGVGGGDVTEATTTTEGPANPEGEGGTPPVSYVYFNYTDCEESSESQGVFRYTGSSALITTGGVIASSNQTMFPKWRSAASIKIGASSTVEIWNAQDVSSQITLVDTINVAYCGEEIGEGGGE
jgi:hypothetical protein